MQKHRTASVGAALITLIALAGNTATALPTQAQVAAPVCRTWVAQPQPDPLDAYHFGAGALAVLSPSDIWTAGTITSPSGAAESGQIHHWDGTTWANLPLPAYDGEFNTLAAITASAPNDIWAVGRRVLHWNGTQWQTVAASLGSDGNLSDIAATAPDNVWAVGSFSVAWDWTNPLAIHWDGHQWQRVARASPRRPRPQPLRRVRSDSPRPARWPSSPFCSPPS